jgi:hypothetical protein
MRIYWLFFLVIPCLLTARKVVLPSPPEVTEGPWFTGPLISPSAAVVPLGHSNYEPYLYGYCVTGTYDSDWKFQHNPSNFWNWIFEPVIQVGIAPWANIEITPSLSYNHTRNAGKWTFGDLSFGVSFQLYAPKDPYENRPYVKLQIGETFPTGKYKNLDPAKKFTDVGGWGTYNTAIGIAIGQLFHLRSFQYILPRLYVQYTIPSPTRIKGFSAYGGGYGTNGKLFPAQVFSVDASIELSFNQNWAFACDAVGSWQTSTRFSGKVGVDRYGNPAGIGFKSGVQFALAPALEYNWSDNLGVIGGVWFVIGGRNTNQFYSGTIAVNYYL